MTDNNLNLAGQGQRFLNFIIDMTTIIILWFALIVGLKLLGFGLTSVDETGEQVSKNQYILLLLIYWGYYLLTEYLSQRTLGKIMTKTKVVLNDGSRPTIKQLIFRTLSRSIPFEYISYLVTVEGIHDKLSKTRVIKI